MISIRRCFALIGLAAAGALIAGTASAQQNFVAPAPDGYPPNWNRATPEQPVTATFTPGSDAYHWASSAAPPPPATASAIVYQMQPGSAHYHHVQ
ncbi:MAG TPA: hypothetical protein VMU85_03010 [Stellaceae bacterium]|nr:hypothetical protein [Stellaceae bacterium]